MNSDINQVQTGVDMCLRLLLRPDAGDSALFHADLSVPELERFEF